MVERVSPANWLKLEEVYAHFVEQMDALALERPLTCREADNLAIAMDYLEGVYADRRPVPDDFDIVLVENGRLKCEKYYGASRLTINRWLLLRGKQRLIEERARFVKHCRRSEAP